MTFSSRLEFVGPSYYMLPKDFIPTKYATLTARRGYKDARLDIHLHKVERFVRRLKNRTKSHLAVAWGWEDEPDTHAHLIIAVHKQDLPLFKRSLLLGKFIPSREWAHRHIKFLNWQPKKAADCFSYVTGGKHNTMNVWKMCPGTKKACRRGICPVHNEVETT